MMKLVLMILVMLPGMFACTKPEDKSVKSLADVAMKEISYSGGLITFSIPSHWKEEYEKDGGGMFYEDSASSGTLRLNVLSFDNTGSSPIDVESAARKQAEGYKGESTVLREGNAMARYDRQATEDGQPITLRTWAIYNHVGDTHSRVVVFTYTVPSAQFGDEKHVKEIEMIDREIRKARFAEISGTVQ